LFTLAIGCGEGTGELLGMIGEYDIRLKIDDLQFTGTWSEEDKTHMYVLQDEVNTVIMQFYEMDGFVAA